MAIPLAFAAVVVIWSTTPLGIKWSGEEVGFLFGVLSRMLIGCIIAMIVVKMARIQYSLSKRARTAYLASGIGIYIGMLFGYWGASYIPSGWISVIWGFSPVLAGILASIFLDEKITFNRLLGLTLGVTGLVIVFSHGLTLGKEVVFGSVLILIGVIGQTGTAIWIKKINARQHGLVMAAAGMLVALPAFFLTWLIVDGELPTEIPAKAGYSILYLSVFGSVIGFSLYFYLIHHLEASKVALVTLITPVTALLIGNQINNEPLTPSVIIGAGFILSGLASFEWGNRLFRAKR